MVKHRTPIDEPMAHELELMVENDAELYRQRLQPIYKNLAQKKAKKIYKHKLAVKLMRYAVDDEARKYKKEYGHHIDVATREAAAESLTRSFERELPHMIDKRTRKFIE